LIFFQKKWISDRLYDIAEILESYSVAIRYPGDGIEPDKKDALEAFSAALEIRQLFSRIFVECLGQYYNVYD
jgi:hypothetical protein